MSAASGVGPDESLAQLMAGNKRFVEGNFPPLSWLTAKRESLKDRQTPFAVILSCCDSRVIPELVFVQGIGELFVTRVVGNYPDDLVIGSIEYAVQNLGTRLVMVLGHENCGAVTAAYAAIENATPLPPHLDAMERLIAPGIQSVVRARGSIKDAVTANVRAAVQALKPALQSIAGGRVRVVGGYYNFGSGSVELIP